MRKYRRWTMEQKRQAVERMAAGKHEELAREIGIPKRQLYLWRREVWEKDHPRESGSARERALERENQRLKEALATKVLEADFLQGVLLRLEARRRVRSGTGETASGDKSK
jgi:transposase-like protein